MGYWGADSGSSRGRGVILPPLPDGVRHDDLRLDLDGEPDSDLPPLRVGVIGVGFGAAVHVPALQALPETEVVGVCARRTDRAVGAAARHQITLATTDFRQLIKDSSVQAVIIATPPYLHHQMVIAALEAGKHVLCEKPMARTLAEAKDMAKMAETAGVVAMVNHEYRFHPVRARVKELLNQGYIGTPQAATVTAFHSTLNDPYGQTFGWLMQEERGGGMLSAAGSHHIDTLRWWLGEINGVAGATATMVDRRLMPDGSGMARVDADDNFAFILRFASGALATVHMSTTSAVDSGEEVILSGSEGMLIAQGEDTLYGARKGDPGPVAIDLPDRLGGDLPAFDHSLIRPTMLLIRRWVRAIRTGEPAPTPSFHDGVKTQEIVDGVQRSGTQGRWIDTSGARWPGSLPRRVGG